MGSRAAVSKWNRSRPARLPARRAVRAALAWTGFIWVAGMEGCASSGPFDEPGVADTGRSRQRVIFEVVCDRCTVRYSTPDGSGRAQVVRSWSQDVRIWVTETGATVELTALPDMGSGSITLARIRVGGDVLEEHRGGGVFDLGTGVTLRTTVRAPPSR